MALLRYLTLPSNPNALRPEFSSYAFASRVQRLCQREFLAWKARPPSSRGPPPPPSIIAFTPAPTYTLGRRQKTEPLSEAEVARLRSPLFVPTPSASGKGIANNGGDANSRGEKACFSPTITNEPRGGLTTYHGPGQLVIWTVIDLHSPLHAHLSVRDYACLLEKTTIATLGRLWGLNGFTTENPGVWVRSRDAPGQQDGGSDERKIAALGVHIRRHITGSGVAVNYNTPVTGPSETNPWGRIVACGLGDRGVTSVRAELGHNGTNDSGESTALADLGNTWRSEFMKRLQVTDGTVGYDSEQLPESVETLLLSKDENIKVELHPFSTLKT